jgi:PPOX class probable F420-dependent enzyme
MTLPATSAMTDRVRRFLQEPRYAVVATTDDDGAPRQAVVWFLFDDDTIVVNSLDGRRWPANLRRDPRIAIAISESDRESWVGLTGTIEVVDDQALAQADIAAMARRFHAKDPAAGEAVIANRFTKQRRVSFRLRPAGIHDHIED